jgi:hypothetical protein
MVEVKFDVEGMDEAEAQGTLLKTLRFYQLALGDLTCPTHGTPPSLLVVGRAPKRLGVSIEACCGDLTRAADARVRGASRRDEGKDASAE